MSPLVSFVIPSHNCAEYLGAAVESVRAQTFKDLEIIVVNDGSTDSTWHYLDWLAKNEPRAIILTNDDKKGRSFSRNRGNHFANGKCIYVLDADDLAHPKRVELTLPMIKKSDFVHGGALFISTLGFEMGALKTEKFNLDQTRRDFLRQSFIVHSTVCYTKEFATKYPYREQASEHGIDDWDQQITAALDGARFDFTPHTLAYYRNNPDNITNTRDTEKVMEAKKSLHPSLFKEESIV